MVILFWTWIRAQPYSMRMMEEKEATKKSKGVKVYVVEKTMTF